MGETKMVREQLPLSEEKWTVASPAQKQDLMLPPLSSSNASSSFAPTSSYGGDELRDPRDEEDLEDSFDDPYVYSDDSASLSDAYFFPQSDDDLARPPRYRGEDDALKAYPVASYYGSLTSSGALGVGGSGMDRSPSPLWVGGSIIQEDSELVDPPDNNMFFLPPHLLVQLPSGGGGGGPGGEGTENSSVQSSSYASSSYYRKRYRRHSRRLQLKELERRARERAVAAIRGKPQDVQEWHDWFFAALFLLQLVAVMACAAYYGYQMYQRTHDAGGPALWWKIKGDGAEEMDHTTTSLPWFFRLRPNPSSDSSTASSSSSSSSPLQGDPFLRRRLQTLVTEIVNESAASNDSSNSVATALLFTIDYTNVIALVSVGGFYACILTYISFGFMLILARALIQIMLIFSVLLALAWGTIGLTLDPYGVISIMGFTFLLGTLGYSIASWNRIPFAATNLHTALCAMRCTADITILGLVSLLVAFAWCIIWTMAFVGIVNSFNSAECTQNLECDPQVPAGHIPLYLVMLFSFHWTNTVIKNIVRVTVASAIGTWWFRPSEMGPFCTAAVLRPLGRSLTKSLGSICLASLVVQPATVCASVLRLWCCFWSGDSPCVNGQIAPAPTTTTNITGSSHTNLPMTPASAASTPMSNGTANHNHHNTPTNTAGNNAALLAARLSFSAVPAGDGPEQQDSAADSLGLCQNVCQARNRCRSFVRSCNRWSYTYIGMYGYRFSEAGERALQLFETREWVDVVKDDLIPNVLLMASMIIGGSTGTFAVVVEETDGYDFTSFHKPIISAFVVGSVMGFVLSNILLLGVVAGAVDTILVCFAAGPFDFHRNHPRLSREMLEVWSQQVWETNT